MKCVHNHFRRVMISNNLNINSSKLRLIVNDINCSAKYSDRIANAQCHTDEVEYDGDRLDNPIFEGGGFIGTMTLSECQAACDSRTDSNGRPCVAIEWSDGGNEQSDSTAKSCALAWACDWTESWGGGSVFTRGTMSITFHCEISRQSVVCIMHWIGMWHNQTVLFYTEMLENAEIFAIWPFLRSSLCAQRMSCRSWRAWSWCLVITTWMASTYNLVINAMYVLMWCSLWNQNSQNVIVFWSGFGFGVVFARRCFVNLFFPPLDWQSVWIETVDADNRIDRGLGHWARFTGYLGTVCRL